jgi:hypothetical protein
MKGMVLAVCVLACLLVGSGCMTGGYTSSDRAIPSEADSLAMSKHDIIAMSRAKVGDDVIIKMLQTTGSYFRLKSRDVVELADSGVSDKVIAAMIRTSEAPEDHGSHSYYSPYYAPYYPPYWWYGGYPFYYPWSFGFSVGYYAPYYHHRTYATPYYGHSTPYYGHSTPYSRYTSRSYGGHYTTSRPYTGGRTINTGRPSGRRR